MGRRPHGIPWGDFQDMTINRLCGRCGETKPEMFSPKGRSCRQCKREYDLKYRKLPHAVAVQEAYRRREARKISARGMQWFYENRDRHRANDRRWKQENRGRRNFWSRAYEARKRNAIPRWANKEAIAAVYQLAAKTGMHVDHIVPLAGETVCGLHCEANLQLLTPHENRKKNNKIWPDMP